MDSNFFAGNRQRLSKVLPGCFVVLAAHHLLQESADSTFSFRQDSNFWYLTGIDLPDLILGIDTKKGEPVIYLSEKNKYQKEWDGEVDIEKLKKISAIQNFRHVIDLKADLKRAEKNGLQISYIAPPAEFVQPYGFFANPARRNLENLIKSAVKSDLRDVRMEIARLRAIKQEVEIQKIRQAIDVTEKALEVVRKRLQNYKNESEIVRDLSSEFYRNGGDGHAFDPIVATGKNAATIHYRENNSTINDSELLLLDIGAKVGYYASDITRVYAVGKVDERKKEIFKAVQELQNFAFSLLKPGVFLRENQKLVEAQAKKVMKKLNCSNTQDKYPHGISHFLGLDVHDAGDYSSALEPGMVITVEPGIYLKDEGIGVRLEDDVLITRDGFENLSTRISQEL